MMTVILNNRICQVRVNELTQYYYVVCNGDAYGEPTKEKLVEKLKQHFESVVVRFLK